MFSLAKMVFSGTPITEKEDLPYPDPDGNTEVEKVVGYEQVPGYRFVVEYDELYFEDRTNTDTTIRNMISELVDIRLKLMRGEYDQ